MRVRKLSPTATLQECTELDYLLIGDLREMLEEPLTPQSRQWMASLLEVLLESLPHEHRLKCVDGYLNEVVRDFPNWATRVDRLEARHYALYDRLADLRDELDVETPDRQPLNEVRYSLTEWMDALVAHRLDESDLCLAAVNTDIGGG